MSRLALPALLAAGLLAIAQAHALTPGLGELKAVSSGAPLPRDTAVAIQPDASDAILGSDPTYVAAREAATEALRQLGFRPQEDAAVTLKIEVGTPRFDTHRNGDEAASSIISSDATQQLGPGRKARVTDQVQVPLDQPESNGQPGLSLALVLSDPQKHPLWSATFQAGGRVADPEAMIRRMTRAAVATLGAQVQRSYVLTCEEKHNAADGSVCLP
jgi:hypothetical protein